MPVESAADRAVFVAPGEFGATATYTLQGGGASALAGIHDREASRAFDDLASQSPRFTCRSADLPAGARKGDGLSVDGRAYTVQVIDHDGTGIAALTLEEA